MNITEVLGLIVDSYSDDNIMVAAGDGNIDAVKRFLDSGVSPNAQDSSGYSPLHAAASYGHIDILELLVNRGGDVMLKDVDGDTPLHVCEDRTCAEFLLSHGAKYDCGNNEGKTPIWYAVEEDFADMIEYYLGKKLEENPNTTIGGTHSF
ncbi:hypothetical protein JH06_2124 [Blastocystis sp. subtype 4]|uniref:hypothetical protein n=1 Tax=Blastocystis sp. subtype 4 TaxID=944170 RepID=UPI00071136C5|nr:hypothetical protein JH06_2124 [Blastocystis sp. subtype 4]KNB46618.1 hypothetical protein JH06_2124 [Blastocystis sp. subtype 4]|eukprot:XP_014530046.1 hypothetical protein JH06_2124 [Blastocystis sp. subtype 4]